MGCPWAVQQSWTLQNPSCEHLLPHRPEGDRVSALLYRGDAVLPDLPGFAAHHVERTRFGGWRETRNRYPGFGPPPRCLARLNRAGLSTLTNGFSEFKPVPLFCV